MSDLAFDAFDADVLLFDELMAIVTPLLVRDTFLTVSIQGDHSKRYSLAWLVYHFSRVRGSKSVFIFFFFLFFNIIIQYTPCRKTETAEGR